jgi:hypothetical protein
VEASARLRLCDCEFERSSLLWQVEDVDADVVEGEGAG